MITFKLQEHETKEHRANELVNGVLEPCGLLFCGVQETHWLGQEATLKASGFLFLFFGHESSVHRDGVALTLAPKAAASLLS
jgi:hypothetical protein